MTADQQAEVLAAAMAAGAPFRLARHLRSLRAQPQLALTVGRLGAAACVASRQKGHPSPLLPLR